LKYFLDGWLIGNAAISKCHQQSGTEFFSHFGIEMTLLAYVEGFYFSTNSSLGRHYYHNIVTIFAGKIWHTTSCLASVDFIYFISTLASRCLRCDIYLSAHHSLGLLSQAA